MNYRAVASTLLVLSLLPAVGCDKATPVAPSGSTLAISANPAKIDSATGISTIRVTALKPNGTPVNPGTEIRFATDLGTIDEIATTDDSGVARATLRGDGRIGTAKVSATTGGVAMAATIDVEIGSSAKTIVLQATPTTLTSSGGTVTLTALVRDSRGRALAGAGVNFGTDLGTLNSGGRILATNRNGQASDTLRVTDEDVESADRSSFTVTATTADSQGALISDTFQVQLQRDQPEAEFSVSGNGLRVDFNDESTGSITSWSWDFGDDATSTESSPTHVYAAADTYTVVLRVSGTAGSDSITKRVKVESGKPPVIVSTEP